MKEQIRRELVWSKTLRLCHWSLALATLVLLFTGWLVAWAPERATQVVEIHYVAAAVLIATLLVRLWLLLFGQGIANGKVLLPNRHRFRQALQVLRSYLTLGKLPLPRWHAHNPLWAPLYLLLFAALVLQAATGMLLLNQVTLVGDISLRSLHHGGWTFLLAFSTLHVAAVFFHDAKTTTAEISGMVNGHRCLTLEPVSMDDLPGTKVVPLDALLREPKRPTDQNS
jgi:Ni/Fe-hydrogenase 1 B-type cytochrome subunit